MPTDDLQRFIDILPQKYPFLMIDEILEYKEGESLTAVKNVTGNEWIYQGDNDALDRYPESLIMEGAAQTALAFFHAKEHLRETRKFYLGKISAEFRQEARIGDRISFTTGSYKQLGQSGVIQVTSARDKEILGSIQVFYGLLE